MAETFGERLAERVAAVGPLCVGVDPSAAALARWGRDDDAAGAEFLALALVEAAALTATAIKPQVAFFERFGSAGYAVLERVIAEARGANLIVVADAKRADIASTNEGYAAAWLGERSTLASDALTVSGYLGLDALAPLVAAARATRRGLFVLAATSNDDGREVQSARRPDGRTVEEWVIDSVGAMNGRDDGRGSVGVVIGATRDAPDADLSRLGGPVLVPGLGAQGAGPADVVRACARCARSTVIGSVSRAIADAGPARRGLADAAARWRDDLASALG